MSASDAFLLRGYELYPDAAAAMWTFHAHLYRELHSVLDAHTEWGRFRRTPRRWNVGGDPASGWRVYVIQNGYVGEKSVSVEIGYWWSPPTEDRAPGVYATAWGISAFRVSPPQGLTAFIWSERPTVISSMPRDLVARSTLARQLEFALRAIEATYP